MKNQDEFQNFLDAHNLVAEYTDIFRAPAEGERVYCALMPMTVWDRVQFKDDGSPYREYEHSITGSLIRKPIWPFWPHRVEVNTKGRYRWAYCKAKT